MNIFYTYVISVDGVPEYVGKGKDDRCQHHFDGKNHFANHLRKAKREGKDIQIVKKIENASEDEAHQLEIKLIKEIGRRDLNKGTLFNKTDGGEGVSGLLCSDATREKLSIAGKIAYEKRKDLPAELERRQKISQNQKGKIVSDQTKSNISKAKRGNVVISAETRAKISKANKGKVVSAEARQKISLANSGRIFSEEHRKNIGLSSKGRIQPESHRQACRDRRGAKSGRSKLWSFMSPEGKNYITCEADAFCIANGLSYYSLRAKANSKKTNAVSRGPSKGWSVLFCMPRPKES